MHCLEQLECLNLAYLEIPSLKLGSYFSKLNQTTYHVIKVCMHGLIKKQTYKATFSCFIVNVIYYCKNDEIDDRKRVNILTVSQSTNQGGRYQKLGTYSNIFAILLVCAILMHRQFRHRFMRKMRKYAGTKQFQLKWYWISLQTKQVFLFHLIKS